ncbi:conserved Plasmodium protein, unknown function [Plasmodium malariae]|uniref:Uncharacterized protein n=1 Tax=Plasmodium malariae TaxID=5858 RepID=A0A1A8VR27_PLAMA|nr:conserved Plasmodium protein, unknown function [Plasmodium malariae]
MNYSSIRHLQKPLENKLNDSNRSGNIYCNINIIRSGGGNAHTLHFEETGEVEFKSCIRNINHRNKTSVFDGTQNEWSDKGEEKKSNSHRIMKKRIFDKSSSLEIKGIFHDNLSNTSTIKHGKRINTDVRSFYIFSKDTNDKIERKSVSPLCRYFSDYSMFCYYSSDCSTFCHYSSDCSTFCYYSSDCSTFYCSPSHYYMSYHIDTSYPSPSISSKKISSYSLEKNPCKWGVDVLRYSLPPPKKMYRHVDNLSTCLIPNISEDSIIPKKNKNNYATQLEKSLCPKENIFIPNSSRKLIRVHESKLEMNCVPKDCEGSRIRTTPIPHPGNLNAHLTPLVECGRKSLYINPTCRNKICSVSFNYEQEPSPYRSGKRIGYLGATSENSIFLF